MTALGGLEMEMLTELELVDCRTALQLSLLTVLEIPNVAWVLVSFEGFGPFKENKQHFFSPACWNRDLVVNKFSREVTLPSDEFVPYVGNWRKLSLPAEMGVIQQTLQTVPWLCEPAHWLRGIILLPYSAYQARRMSRGSITLSVKEVGSHTCFCDEC